MVSLVLLWPGLLQFGALFYLLKAEFIQKSSKIDVCVYLLKKKKASNQSRWMEGVLTLQNQE